MRWGYNLFNEYPELTVEIGTVLASPGTTTTHTTLSVACYVVVVENNSYSKEEAPRPSQWGVSRELKLQHPARRSQINQGGEKYSRRFCIDCWCVARSPCSADYYYTTKTTTTAYKQQQASCAANTTSTEKQLPSAAGSAFAAQTLAPRALTHTSCVYHTYIIRRSIKTPPPRLPPLLL